MEPEASSIWSKQAMSALEISTDQARGLRKRLLHTEMKASGRAYAYAAIDGQPSEFTAPRSLSTDPREDMWACADADKAKTVHPTVNRAC